MANKSNTTFGFILANHPNRFGYYPVMLRITRDRKTKRVKTELEVKKADWNQKAKNYKHFRDSYDNAEVFNDMLLDILAKYKETFKELKEEGAASAENIIAKVKTGEVSESFLNYAKERTQEIYDLGGIRNWKKYRGFCNKLEAFLKKSRKHDVAFAELTYQFMTKFDAYLHTIPNERNPEQKLHPNTIQVNFNIFKTLVNNAIKAGLMKPEDNPFLNFKCAGVKTEKEKLNADELEKVKKLDLAEGSLIWHCRNAFMFSFYCAGVRAGDLVQLRWCNITSEGRLHYRMGKNHKERDLPLVAEAMDILKLYYREGMKPTDYIFPFLNQNTTWFKYDTQEKKDRMPSDMKRKMFEAIGSKNALINKKLAEIAKLAGIEKRISFHISRHSFAKAAKEKGLDNLEVKELLAHTNIATTQKYMGSFETKKTDEAMRKVFENNSEEELLNQLKGVNPELLKSVLTKLGL